jgi:tRNA 2-thiouridine synthesizing protein A
MPESETPTEFDHSLDAKGLNCPLPVLKTKVQLNRMQPGEVLYVEATDPHSVIDFEAYCARSGHELLSTSETDAGVFEFLIRRAAEAKMHV